MPVRLTSPRKPAAGRRPPLPHALALILAVGAVGGFFATATLLGAIVLNVGDATFSPTLSRSVPYGLAIAATLFAVVIAPLAIDRGVTGAFRRLQPGARGTPLQTFVVWNLLLLAAMVLLAPRASRRALEHYGDWLVRGVLPEPVPGAVARAARWLGSHLPGNDGLPPLPLPAPSTAPPAPSPSASVGPSASVAPAAPAGSEVPPPPASTPAPEASAPAPEGSTPSPVASAAPAASGADLGHDLGADEVFAARSTAVVTVFALYQKADAPKGAPARPLVGAAPGVVVGGEGLVVTLESVLRDASSAVVGLSGGRWSSPVELLATDRARGLVLLKVPLEGLSASPLADAQRLGVGERVVAIAAPTGLPPAMGEAVVAALREGASGALVQVRPLAADPVEGPLFDLRGRLIGLGPAKAEGRGAGPAAVSVKHVHELLALARTPRRLEPWPETAGVDELRLEGDELSADERTQITGVMKLWSAAVAGCAAAAGETTHVTLTLGVPAAGVDPAVMLAKTPPQITSGLGPEGDRCVDKGLLPFHAALMRILLRERGEGGGPTVPLTLSFRTNLSPREGETRPRALLTHYVLKPRKAAPAEAAP
ncbi:MAG: S1C family serine protease [Polyangiaceae bacterium]|jgi:S1-C subfamily serine protease|nr:S1C family serine protease [Polyangiaceae bacterium]